MLRGAAARRYAESVFAIAKDENSFDRWLQDMATIEAVFVDPQMARFLADPKPRLSQKEAAVEQLLSGRIHRLALNVALLLVQRGHAASVPGMRRELQRLINEARNVAIAHVTTAVELDATQAAVVKQRLSILTAKTIELETNVDRSILGGFVARVGDVLIDASLASRLAALRQQLLTGVDGR